MAKLTPNTGGELNPHRPTVPDEIKEVSPILHEYLQDQASTLRTQHNKIQAGDTTFPWEVLIDFSDRQEYTLGSLGKFFHNDYGMILARYVRFAYMNPDIDEGSPIGMDIVTDIPWHVTNVLSRSKEELAIGIGACFERPPSGAYGWIIVSGVNIQSLYSDAVVNNEERVGWVASGFVGLTQHKIGRVKNGIYIEIAPDVFDIIPGSFFIDALTMPTKATEIPPPSVDIEAEIQRLEDVIERGEGSILLRFDRIQADVQQSTSAFTRSISMLAERMASVSPEAITASIRDDIYLAATYRHLSEVAAANAVGAAQGAETTLTAINISLREAQISATDAGFFAESSTTMRNEATLFRNEAGVSATAAALSEQNASVSETDAGTYAAAALTHSTSASTSAGTAATQASNASTSASQASTSASSAAGSASSASVSATAASTSASSAQSVANRLLPEKPGIHADFIGHLSPGGITENQAILTTYYPTATVVTVSGEGLVFQIVGAVVTNLLTRGKLPVSAGRTFKAEARITTNINPATDPTNNYVYQPGFFIYDALDTFLGTVDWPIAVNSTVATGWHNLSNETTSTEIIAAFPTASFVRAASEGGRRLNETDSGSSWRLSILRLRDITSETAAATSATAAATQALNAQTSATEAESSATASQASSVSAASSATAADVSADAASNSATASATSESQASTSASGAAASASSATTQANNAATSAGNASTSASAASTSATNASNSAAAASVSATIAVEQVNRLLPDRPSITSAFSNGNTSFTGQADITGSIVAVANEGDVRNITPTYISSKGAVAFETGKTYRVKTRGRITVTGTGSTSDRLTGFFVFNSSKAYLGSITLATGSWTAAAGFTNDSLTKTTAQILAAFGTAAYIKPYYQFFVAAGTGWTWEAVYIRLEDVTTTSQVETLASAVIDGSGNALAAWETTVVAGEASAAIRMRTQTGPGVYDSTIALEAEEFQVFDGTSRSPSLKIAGGKTLLTGDVEVNGAILIGVRRIPIALQSFQVLAGDGEAVDYGTDLVNLPTLIFETDGLAAKTAAQSYDVKALNQSSTGHTMRAKILTVSSGASVSSGPGSDIGGTPRWQMDKSDAADSYNSNYTFTATLDIVFSSGEPGFYEAVGEYECFVRPSGGAWTSIGTIQKFFINSTQATVSKTFSGTLSYGNAIGQHATDKEFGISAVEGVITAFGSVVYTKQGTSGESSATPNGEKVRVTVVPNNS